MQAEKGSAAAAATAVGGPPHSPGHIASSRGNLRRGASREERRLGGGAGADGWSRQREAAWGGEGMLYGVSRYPVSPHHTLLVAGSAYEDGQTAAAAGKDYLTR